MSKFSSKTVIPSIPHPETYTNELTVSLSTAPRWKRTPSGFLVRMNIEIETTCLIILLASSLAFTVTYPSWEFSCPKVAAIISKQRQVSKFTFIFSMSSITKLASGPEMWSLAGAVESAPQVGAGAARLARIWLTLLGALAAGLDARDVGLGHVALVLV